MSLIPYQPFRHLEDMRREMDRFFRPGFPSITTGLYGEMEMPRVDVYETENEVVATCDLPGLEKKEDVHIDVSNNVLTISGSVSRVNEINEEQMHRRERYMGRFQRSISLPTNVSSEGVKARYKNGVLEVRMLKEQREMKRQIDVEFH